MKKAIKFAAVALCAAALAISCNKNDIEINVTPSAKTITMTCTIADSGTKLGISDTGKVTWEVNDQILFHGKWIGGQYSYTATLSEANISQDGKTATVTIEDFTKGSPTGDQASNIYAIYPASAVAADNGATNWRATHPFNTSNAPLMVGYNKETDGTSFTFINLCGLIAFSVEGEFDNYELHGNNDEVVGYDGYQAEVYWTTNGTQSTNLTKGGTPLTSISAPLNADGTTVHYACIPNGVTFTKGFTFKFKDGNSTVKIKKTEKTVTIPRNGLLNLGKITNLEDYEAPTTSDHVSGISNAKDLSESGAANCYVITSAGSYKLPVVKGNNKEISAGNVFGAEVLWETYNNDTEVEAKSVIAAVDFDGPENYIYFSTPETLKPGNALIAAKDSEGNIIWSWHIWIPETSINSDLYANAYGFYKAMDRNLGALVPAKIDEPATVESFGLFYQWGRKDPFPGPQAVKSSSAAVIAGTATSKSTVQITIAEAIANPTMFAYDKDKADVDYEGGNWCVDEISTAWSDSDKSIYDPCPAGYRVPARNENQPAWKGSDWVYDSENLVCSLGDLVFPLAGYMDDNGGSYSYPSVRAEWWSSTSYSSNHSKGRCMYAKGVAPAASYAYKARGASVRCVSISEEPAL